jgi:pyrroline-5-carboxylate reductase
VRPVAILGAGNLGSAIARGLVRSGLRQAPEVHLTHLEPETLADFAAQGHPTGRDNVPPAKAADVLIVAVRPHDVVTVIQSVRAVLDPERHVIVSTATGVGLATLRAHVGPGTPVVRAMPNLGIQTLSSMTCLAAGPESEGALARVEEIFGGLGETIRIDEANMNGATALCASGTAFFLRAIRAASQGGVEVGFHGEDAIRMAAQTAKGAAELILFKHTHPETEIERVTTPNGCTIAGLNEMESLGFSSAFTKGVVAAAKRAAALYSPEPGGR